MMTHGAPSMMPPMVAPPRQPNGISVVPDPQRSGLWTEYEDNSGKSYYHNLITGETTYDKPEYLKSDLERSTPKLQWKEYNTSDGKRYFSDGIDSQWEEPDELRKYKGATLNSNDLAAGETRGYTSRLVLPTNSSAKISQLPAQPEANVEPVVYATKQEATAAFKAMLQASGVSSTMKWPEVMRTCAQERAWNALKTPGERKQCWAEFQTKLMKEEKEEKRVRARKARDGFLKMLAENTKIDSATRWREAQEMLGEVSSFAEVEDEREREELFSDFIMELSKTEKEEKRAARKAGLGNFRTLLQETPGITYKCKWLEARAMLEESNDSRFAAVDDSDRRHTFQEYIAELLDEQDKLRQQHKDEKKKQERRTRDNFREYLLNTFGKELHGDSKWKDFIARIETTELYSKVETQSGPTAREIFEDTCDDLRETFRCDKKVIRDAQKRAGVEILRASNLQGFCKQMLDFENQIADAADRAFGRVLERSEINVQLYFLAQMEKVEESYKEEQRRRKKAEGKFKRLLEDYYFKAGHEKTTFVLAIADLKRHSAYDAIGEEARRNIFDEHMSKLGARLAEEHEACNGQPPERESEEWRGEGTTLDDGKLEGKNDDKEKIIRKIIRKRSKKGKSKKRYRHADSPSVDPSRSRSPKKCRA